MKTLTIKQPWASLIVEGLKDIENRTWSTNYRGIILIHAAKTIDKNAVEKISTINGELARRLWSDINDNKLPTGAIIGAVKIVDCVVNHSSVWAEKTKGKIDLNTNSIILADCQKPIYNWVLANHVKFPEPIPAKGKLSFWDYRGISTDKILKNG